jgi:hypothetical protein
LTFPEYIDKRLSITDIKGKNRGFVANSFIPKYTIVLIDKPYKIYDSVDHLNKNIKNDIKIYKIDDQFRELSPHDIHIDNRSYYSQKISNNAFGFDRKKKTNACLLFYGTIFNHSCNPNILFTNSPTKRDCMIFYTIRDIQKNTELVDHYIDVNLSFDKRKKLLKSYGFTCDCEACKNKETVFCDYIYHEQNIL